MTVLHDDDLVGLVQLFVHGAAEGGLEVSRSITAIDRQEKGEGSGHVKDARDAVRPSGEQIATLRWQGRGSTAERRNWSTRRLPGVHVGVAERPAGTPSVTRVKSPEVPVERVVCVVVTHERPESLARCLAAVAAQTRKPDHLVVVDNACDEDTLAILDAVDLPHTYLPSRTNLGGAGGFAYGILTARALGADWVWLADDDGSPGDERTLETLLAYAGRLGLDAVSPLVVDAAEPTRLAFPLRQGREWLRTRADLGSRNFLPGIAQLFNGALFTAHALDALGVPDPRLFIRGDEVEIHRRLVRSRLRFGTVVTTHYRHPSGASDFVPILGGRLPVYLPANPDRAAIAFRNQGYLTSQPGMRWRRWPDEVRYAVYYLAEQRDVSGWRTWRQRTAEGRREQFGL